MMVHDTPLRKQHEAFIEGRAERRPDAAATRPGAATGERREPLSLEYVRYGPPGDAPGPVCEVPASFGELEAEYAALRGHAGLVDAAHRGTIRVGGGDRVDFLDRMLTQRLAGLSAGQVRSSFWLSRQGRIQSDLLIAELGDEILIDVDRHDVARTCETLDAFLFAEDVTLEDVSQTHHHVVLHGPAAPAVLAAAGAGLPDDAAAARLTIAGIDVVVIAREEIGGPGFVVIAPTSGVESVWARLVAVEPARPSGWWAYNIARIEAGTPLMNVDFGVTNLPHETGVLRDRVSFEKGCYLGQEIVARIESLGQPKQQLVGLTIEGDLLPVAEGQVFAPDQPATSTPIGVVTSSTLSPMLGRTAVAFAMLKSAFAEPGTRVSVHAEGETVPAVVGPLRFWPKTGSA